MILLNQYCYIVQLNLIYEEYNDFTNFNFYRNYFTFFFFFNDVFRNAHKRKTLRVMLNGFTKPIRSNKQFKLSFS